VLTLLALEEECDRHAIRPHDADRHGAVRSKGVAFERNCAGLGGLDLQDAMIPTGFALEVFAVVNCGVALGVGDVTVEKSLGGAFILEAARDGDDAIPIVDGHSPGLNDWLAGEVALGGCQRPDAVQGAVVAREGGAGQEGRQDGSGDCSP
jgi:hypothetical protein